MNAVFTYIATLIITYSGACYDSTARVVLLDKVLNYDVHCMRNRSCDMTKLSKKTGVYCPLPPNIRFVT